MNEQSEYWILSVKDDLITADAMLATKRLLWAGFVCQLIADTKELFKWIENQL